MPEDASATSPARILVVDDEPHIRRLLAVRLEAEGFEVFEARDGEEGLRRFEEVAPDLVLLDLMMPGANGLEILARLRGSGVRPHVPVFILTAKGQDTDRELALAGGATDFVTKPFSPMKLLARIHEVLDAS